MAEHKNIDPRSGYCSKTKIFHSLRPPVPLPPASQPISITEYARSLFHDTISSPGSAVTLETPFLIDSATGQQLTHSSFLNQVHSLSVSLQSHFPSISRNDVAFILSPPSFHIPVLYFSLLSLGITVSPANPLSTTTELNHLFQLTKPAIVFTTSSILPKLPTSFQFNTILLDSPQFLSMISSKSVENGNSRVVNQDDTAAILYSSGTTGRVKGVELTHRNLIAIAAGMFHNRYVGVGQESNRLVSLFPLPMFHVFGFFMLIRGAANGQTFVLLNRFDFEDLLKAVERYKVMTIPVSPPLVVALAKSELVDRYDLSSLQMVGSGGAPLGKEVSERFVARLPFIVIIQGYGLTESTGAGTRMLRPEEAKRFGSAGRLAENLEAKIVDPDTKEPLPPGQRGELWLRGPTVMKVGEEREKISCYGRDERSQVLRIRRMDLHDFIAAGYVGDAQATAETLDPDGWLKTGDLCYFDSDGFLFIVDRLKELIKYKGYQVPPAELEHLLQAHPGVADVAVIPYPDEEAGQIPLAYIVRKPESSVTEAQILDFVAKQVAPYKKIRRVSFIKAIPKNPSGKILRRELVSQAVSASSSKL